MGIFTEMGLPGQSDIDFGIEEITDEDSDDDDDYENDDEDDDDDDDDDEVKFLFQITSKGTSLGLHRLELLLLSRLMESTPFFILLAGLGCHSG